MPFIAMNQATDERVDITKIANPRLTLRAADMACPVCGWPMIVKAGMIMRPHFSHKPGRENCPYADYASGETQEHRDAKTILRDNLGEWFGEYGMAEPELEVYIPDVKHARNRIADLLFTFPSGWRVAHEIQLASITVRDLEERTEDYLNAGIDVFWWLGRNAATSTNFEWSMRTYGFVLEILIQDESSTAEYALHDTTVDDRPLIPAMVGR